MRWAFALIAFAGCGDDVPDLCAPTTVASVHVEGFATRPAGISSLAPGDAELLIWRHHQVADAVSGTRETVSAWTVDTLGETTPINILPSGCGALCRLERVVASQVGAGFLWTSSGTDISFTVTMSWWDGATAVERDFGTSDPENVLPPGYLDLAWIDDRLVASKPTHEPAPGGVSLQTLAWDASTTQLLAMANVSEAATDPEARARLIEAPDLGGAIVYGDGVGTVRQLVLAPFDTMMNAAEVRGEPGDALVDAIDHVGSDALLVCRGSQLILLRAGAEASIPGACEGARLLASSQGLLVLRGEPASNGRRRWTLTSVDESPSPAHCVVEAQSVAAFETSVGIDLVWADESGDRLTILSAPNIR